MNRFDAVQLMIRVVLGVVIIAHGYNHIWGGGRIQGTARWFEGIGIKPGIVNAWASALTELGAGGGLILGLFTSLDCAGIVAVMVVAGITNHWQHGFFIFREGYEYVMVLAFVALSIAVLGPGKYSLDRALKIDDNLDGTTGGLITLLVGVGGALALLAVCWRPVKKDTAQ